MSAPVFSFCLVWRVAIVFALRENWVDNWVESCVSLEDAVLDVRASIGDSNRICCEVNGKVFLKSAGKEVEK